MKVNFSPHLQRCIVNGGHDFQIIRYDTDGDAERHRETHVHIICTVCGHTVSRVASVKELAELEKLIS